MPTVRKFQKQQQISIKAKEKNAAGGIACFSRLFFLSKEKTMRKEQKKKHLNKMGLGIGPVLGSAQATLDIEARQSPSRLGLFANKTVIDATQ